MKVIFRKYKKEDCARFEEMVKLFAREESDWDIPVEHIKKTLKEFSKFPEKGTIYIFVLDQKIVGYAALVNYWNMYAGGNYLAVDEIFVDAAWRGRGIATAFIEYLQKSVSRTFVAISLEVGRKNKKAKKLYQKLGFQKEGYEFMISKLKRD